MLTALEITRLHDQATLRWHQDPAAPVPLVPAASAAPAPTVSLIELALAHHRANFDLWHEEDKAREPGASDAAIARVKCSIDSLNQTRNDLVEAIDRLLLAAAGVQNPAAPLHSESPGLILDRLSVLALKLYHTAEEAHRPTASTCCASSAQTSPPASTSSGSRSSQAVAASSYTDSSRCITTQTSTPQSTLIYRAHDPPAHGPS
jgi:hypothetical protein